MARDLNDLRRVHQLLSSSLGQLQAYPAIGRYCTNSVSHVSLIIDKLKTDGRANKKLVFSETAESMEKLAVLRAWAEVFTVNFSAF